MFEDVESGNERRGRSRVGKAGGVEVMECFCSCSGERLGSELECWQGKWRGTDVRDHGEGESQGLLV